MHGSHAIKEGNLTGLTRWITTFGAGTDLATLVATGLADIQEAGGILHLWGHAWELEEFGLWEKFEDILGVISGHADIGYLTNGQVLDALEPE